MPTKYKTVSGDTWDFISYKKYGSCKYTDKVIAENIKYMNVVMFPAGVDLTLPDIAVETASTLPPWKR